MAGAAINVTAIGCELEPVVTVEDFAPDPHGLRRHAAGASFAPDDLHYPGVKAALAPGYFDALQPVIATVMREVFGFRQGANVLRATYSLVTTPPHLLSIEQRMPHVDAIEPGRMAILHYLALDDGDGTGFYRHRSTGFETITPERGAAYFESLESDLSKHGSPLDAYINGDTAIFERIAHFEARFNRALIYRGRLLHSGAISPGRNLPCDALTGRLTIASFLAAQ